MSDDKPRLDEVARIAQVSRATASKALNGRSDVSDATRVKVLAAAEEVGYRRSTIGAPQPLIAWVADNLTTTYTLDILRGSAMAAQEAGIGLVTQYTATHHGTLPPLGDDWFDAIAGHEWLGVIAVTSRLSRHQVTRIRDRGISFVAIDPANTMPADMTSIGATNWNGGVDATQHLVDLGHRRIGFVRGTVGSVPASERLQGYLSALSMNDLPHDPRLVVGSSFEYEDGVQAGLHLLSLDEEVRPTAIVACNDPLALGVYSAARHLGMQIPDDVSVVGYDDSLMAGLATPGLTTVHQPLQDMGSSAVRTLLAVHAGRSITEGPVRLATTLVVRDSTAAPLEVGAASAR